MGGKDLALAAEGGRSRREQGGTSSIIRGFWLLETSFVSRFHLDIILFFHHVYGF